MRIIKIDDTIKMGVYAGEKLSECIKKYGKKSLLEVLKYYELDDELSRKYYHKKEDQKVEVQTIEKKDEEYPHPWEGTERNHQEYFETYDEMQSSEFDYSEECLDSYDGVDDEYWYSLYVEGKNPVSMTTGSDVSYDLNVCNYEPEELSEELMVREMNNKGYKFWIYG